MHTGVVLFFSACKTKALIWCDDPSCAPLCQANHTDFPVIWSRLEVGTMVRMSVRQSGTVARCITLEPSGLAPMVRARLA